MLLLNAARVCGMLEHELLQRQKITTVPFILASLGTAAVAMLTDGAAGFGWGVLVMRAP